MGWNWNYDPYDINLDIDVNKDFDLDIHNEVSNEYDLDVYVDKDIYVDVDIRTDIDLEDNSAVTTGTAENDSTIYLMDVASSTYVDDWNSRVNSEVTVGELNGTSLSPVAVGAFQTQAYGEETYAELDLTVNVTDLSTVISWTGESAED